MYLSSPYWYQKTPIPESIRGEINCKTNGVAFRHLSVGGSKKQLLLVTGDVFADVFTLNRPYIFHGEYTASAAENDYMTARNYLISDGLAGFSISADGWLMSLFSNLPVERFLNEVNDIIKTNVNKLVCIASEDCYLVSMYERMGFSVCAATEEDRELMRLYHGDRFMDDYLQYHKSLRHIFMIHGNTVMNGIRYFQDYFEALEHVCSIV